MAISSAFTPSQLCLLEHARRGGSLPAVDVRPTSFRPDVDLLAFFGLLALREVGPALGERGRPFLADFGR
jgi:hypothetical protein